MISPVLARLTLLSLVAALGWLFAVAVDIFALSPLVREEQRAAELRTELAALRQRAREAEADLARRLRASDERPPLQLSMIGPDIEATSVSMQEIARGAVARSGGISVSSQASVGKSPGGGMVTILVRARFSELGLLSFIRAMETSDPPMLVESFELSTLPGTIETPLEFSGIFLGFHSDAL